MLRRPHHRRAGFSLTEVLVALFLVSAGLIALLTLFPLGAIQMGYAFRDDRSQQTALQADAKVRDLWRSRVLEQDPPTDDFYNALNDADGAGNAFPPLGVAIPQVSYPVLYDPIGWASYTAAKQNSAAGRGSFPRRSATPAFTLLRAMNYASLVDDMDFATDGTPADRDGVATATSGNNLVRQGRFNWAAVIQRPDSTTLRTAELKILVFDRRAPGVNPTAPNNELAVTGTSVSQAAGSNLVRAGDPIITLNGSNETLGLRVGSWIMDGTVTNDANGDGTVGDAVRNANFYRVTAVNDTNPALTTVELHTPVVRPRGSLGLNPAAAYQAHLYLFRELIDVYDRPPLAPSGYQPQQP